MCVSVCVMVRQHVIKEPIKEHFYDKRTPTKGYGRLGPLRLFLEPGLLMRQLRARVGAKDIFQSLIKPLHYTLLPLLLQQIMLF